MPVDPGNLLLLGRKGATPVVGVPGCARSLKPSGFDWVLERLAADLAVTRADLMRLGAGGLLAEVSRPSPRHAPADGRTPRVAAIVLAAGLSRRMGGQNKLLAEIDGTPIVRRVVQTLVASRADPVLVVVGHQADRIRAALAGLAVRFVENAAYEEGLGASLRAGVEAVGDDVDGALVALGDMPWIRAEHVDLLIEAFDPEGPHTICVPVHDRKRGHPVLWSSRHFGEMRKLGGDVGARELLERHADAVQAVVVDDPAVHLDIDTPEMLAGAAPTKG
jgi:molybdenum cofactor cytidylyltransferase